MADDDFSFVFAARSGGDAAQTAAMAAAAAAAATLAPRGNNHANGGGGGNGGDSASTSRGASPSPLAPATVLGPGGPVSGEGRGFFVKRAAYLFYTYCIIFAFL